MTKLISAFFITMMSMQNNVLAHPGHAGDHFHDFPSAFVVVLGSLIILYAVYFALKKR
ncbi:MAG: hypothetical protein HQ480_04455 [Candidatus Pelagibacter sp.]|jgi:hypothetical protein|nr:hypothetical protein [Candidatus Pelagibacter sp.]